MYFRTNLVSTLYATVEIDANYFRSINEGALWNNVEGQIHYAYLAVHRVAEVAKAMIHAYYGWAISPPILP